MNTIIPLHWTKQFLYKAEDAVLLLNAKGEIKFANLEAEKFFNEHEKNLIDTNISLLLKKYTSVDLWLSAMEELQEKKLFCVPLEIPGKRKLLAKLEYFENEAENEKFISCTICPEKSIELPSPYLESFKNSCHFKALLNADGSISELNKIAEKILDQSIFSATYIWETLLFNQSDTKKDRIKSYILEANDNAQVVFTSDFLNRRKKRKIFKFTLKGIENGAHLLLEGHDISKLKKSEATMRKSEYMYRTLAQNIPNILFLRFDTKLRFNLAEGQALGKLNANKEEILGKTIEDIVPAEDLQEILPYYHEAIQGKTNTQELHFKDAHFLLTFAPAYNDANELDGGILIGYDISKLKVTENLLNGKLKELASLNQKLTKEIGIRREIEINLKEYSEELKLKNNELEQFAYVASHDLQEPLRMISSFTQLLAHKYQKSIDADADEFIKYILEGATRMQRLINDLLIYSRVGRKGSEFKKVKLEDIVQLAKENLKLTIEETDTKIEYENLQEVCGDSGQLTQLMQNLFSNAIKFRSKSSVPKIKISATEKEVFWEIKVKDNGIGFDMNQRDRIFNIFQRLHSQGEYSGTGIGLAICKKIAERHGGEICAESAPGEGATFQFTLRKP